MELPIHSHTRKLFHLILINCWTHILGGTCAAWFGDRESLVSTESTEQGAISTSAKKSNPLNADLFGSLCYTFQLGNFRKYYGDLTRVDARLDISSASAFAKRFLNGSKSSSSNVADDPNSHPRLNLIFQQQVFFYKYIPYVLVFHMLVQEKVCGSKLHMIRLCFFKVKQTPNHYQSYVYWRKCKNWTHDYQHQSYQIEASNFPNVYFDVRISGLA